MKSVEERIKQVLQESIPDCPDDIRGDMHLERDLGVDHMARLDIEMGIEVEFDIDASHWDTVDDIVRSVL